MVANVATTVLVVAIDGIEQTKAMEQMYLLFMTNLWLMWKSQAIVIVALFTI